MGCQPFAQRLRRDVGTVGVRQRLELLSGRFDVLSGGEALQIELGERSQPHPRRQLPHRVVAGGVGAAGGAAFERCQLRRVQIAARLADMSAGGEAVDVELQQRRIAQADAELPELDFRRRRLRSSGAEGELPGEGRVLPGDLLPAGRGDDIATDLDHHRGDILSARGDMAHQRRREGAVPTGAVIGDIVGLGGIGDQEVGGVADTGEPVPQGHPHSGRARRYRVVAAGIQENQVDPPAAFKAGQDRLQGDHGLLDARGVADIGVDGHEVILRVDLEAVPRIVEQRDIGLPRPGGEALDEITHRGEAEILAGQDLEALLPQRLRDVGCVVLRILELVQAVIGAQTHDQGDPPFRCGGAARHEGGEQERHHDDATGQRPSPRPPAA